MAHAEWYCDVWRKWQWCVLGGFGAIYDDMNWPLIDYWEYDTRCEWFLCWLYKVVFHGLGIRDEWCTYHISKPYYEQYMYMYTACVYIDSIDYMFRVVCWKVLLFLQCDLIVQNITWIYAYQPRLSRINPLQKQLFQRGFWISLRNN